MKWWSGGRVVGTSFFFFYFEFGHIMSHGLNELKTSNNIERNYSWTELLAINIVSIYILILAVCLIFHNKVFKNVVCVCTVYFNTQNGL